MFSSGVIHSVLSPVLELLCSIRRVLSESVVELITADSSLCVQTAAVGAAMVFWELQGSGLSDE